MARLSDARHDELARDFRRDGFCILRDHFPRDVLAAMHEAFLPLLHKHIEREGNRKNRGNARYYVTLPFVPPFAVPSLYEDDDVLAIVDRLVGPDPVMCQLATDTPLLGSEPQEIHRDTPSLFPELDAETPPFQLAVNFPLVDVTRENGPTEVTRGTQNMVKEQAMRLLESGGVEIEPLYMKVGDVMVRDVRALHRGTANLTPTPRPMVVIGYSRRWLFRPEVSIRIPRSTHETLSPRARQLLRFNPVVDALGDLPEPEIYQAFAY